MDDATQHPNEADQNKKPTGRTPAGRFAPGNPGGPGRKPRLTEAARLAEIQAALNAGGDWADIIRVAIENAKLNDYHAREWLSNYVIGKPKQTIGISREVDEDEYPEFDGLSIEEIRAIARGEVPGEAGSDMASEE